MGRPLPGPTQPVLLAGDDMELDLTFALTAEYPDLADAPEPMLHAVAAALSEHYAVPYDGLWINLYRDHRDSTGWHGDRPTCDLPVLRRDHGRGADLRLP